jgi:uncharacterized protein
MTVKWTMATPCVLALSVLALLLSVPVKAASFDCGKARTATEIAICRDSSLGRLDEQIAELYAGLRSASVSSERSKLLKAQRRFLQNRNSCGGSLSCLRNRYDSRLADLCNLASVKRLDAKFLVCGEAASKGIPTDSLIPDLLSIEGELDGMCRAWSGDDPHTDDVCAVRDKAYELLGKMGYCFGKKGQLQQKKQWHRCTKNSIRF